MTASAFNNIEVPPEDPEILAIGREEAVRDFQGCSTADPEIAASVTEKFTELCSWLAAGRGDGSPLGTKEPVKVWLAACLAKTLKEQIRLADPIPGLEQPL